MDLDTVLLGNMYETIAYHSALTCNFKTENAVQAKLIVPPCYGWYRLSLMLIWEKTMCGIILC